MRRPGSSFSVPWLCLGGSLASLGAAWTVPSPAHRSIRPPFHAKLQAPAHPHPMGTTSLCLQSDKDDAYDDGDDFFSDLPSSPYSVDYDDNRRSSPPEDSYSSRPPRRGSRTTIDSRYTRDTSRDASNVDESLVEDLLRQRESARRSRDYAAADRIRDQLLQEHSVAVSDRDRTWRTGCSASGSGLKYNGNRQPRGEREFGRRVNGMRQDSFPRDRRDPPRSQNRWNEHGHDYSVSPDAGPNSSDFNDQKIHELIATRLKAKMSRDFRTADAIQRQLIGAGVDIHDARREWRADGLPIVPGSGSRLPTYGPSPFSLPLEEEQTRTVVGLMAKRARYQTQRRYDEADTIADSLREEFNLYIDDSLKQWSVGGDFGEEANQRRKEMEELRQRNYIESGSSLGLESPDDHEQVAKLIEARTQAKKTKNYKAADAILDRLQSQFNVVVLDRLKLWSVGGDFSSENGGIQRRVVNAYQRIGGGGENLTPEELQAIEELLREREKARRAKRFKEADSYEELLFGRFQVKTDDNAKQWWIHSEGYIREQRNPSSTRRLTAEEVENVQKLLEERTQHKLQNEFNAADAIRDRLREVYSVAINDKARSWWTLEEVNGPNEAETDTGVHELVASSPTTKVAIIDEAPDSDEVEDDTQDREIAWTREQLSALTVPELKEKLRSAGKLVTGKKADLIERILA